jgi:hypothetical protein
MSDEKLSWNEVPDDQITEKVTAEDQKAAELGIAGVPWGKYLCECISSTPELVNLKEYSTWKAKLRFSIIVPLEVEGKPGNTRSDLIEKSIFDDVLLSHPKENVHIKNRRIFIAKRLGLIDENCSEIPRSKWAVEIIGKKAILTLEENTYEKNGVTKKNTKVSMFGYDYATSVTASKSQTRVPANIDDI